MYVNGLQLEAIVIVFQNVLFVDTIIDFVFILVGRSSFDSAFSRPYWYKGYAKHT